MSIIDKQALEWVVRQAGPPLQADERAEFDAWYAADARHRGAYLRAQAIEHALQELGAQEGASRQNAQFDGAPHARRSFFQHGLRYGGLAAALALGAGIAAFSFHVDSVEIVTAKGELRSVRLGDHSLARVNSDSQVAVSIGAFMRRAVIGRGEAWFEVAKDPDRPFLVEAGYARVRAIGTAFNVRRADGESHAEVVVTEGVVEVWSKDAGVVRRVHAGQRAWVAYQSVGLANDPDAVTRALAWHKRTLVLTGQTLESAVADFNRHSRRPIVVADPALLQKTLVGQYGVDKPELFARDMGTFLNVPVLVTAERIVIGTARPAATAP